jgi:hypothetical protein
MNYQAQVLEKLYREAYNVFSADEQLRSEARRFIGSHLGAMTVMTGTLGLPFATVAAAAYDKLKDLIDGDDEEPSDIQSQWRNFLEGVLGKDVAEVLARGLPRAIGIDISQRAGEADLLPFSRFMADKRKLEDALESQALDSWGAPAGMVMSMVKGMRDFSNGDVLSGMKQVAPIFLKGPVEAYRMSEKGFTDPQGRTLPMTVEAQDILSQALGFVPAKKAEYAEHKQTMKDAKDVSLQRAGVIRRKLIEAVQSGDDDAKETWMETAMRFDRSHPGYEILPGISGSIQKGFKDAAVAEMLHQPLGVSAKQARASRINWANWQ